MRSCREEVEPMLQASALGVHCGALVHAFNGRSLDDDNDADDVGDKEDGNNTDIGDDAKTWGCSQMLLPNMYEMNRHGNAIKILKRAVSAYILNFASPRTLLCSASPK